jgi:serine/threonine-protein kinase
MDQVVRAGAQLGNYRIDRSIGRGGMGEVFLAYDTSLHRPAALKVLASSRVDGAREHLLREARSAAALNHPNICTVHEVGEHDGLAYIAMEFVEGRPLSELLSGPALPLPEAMAIGTQVASALAHAHASGVVHRDFKAANVIVMPDGRAKIVDFGLAKRYDSLTVDATTLMSAVPVGAVAGTPYAMAPEQVTGRDTDARTDVWAFGVLLHEMVAGGKPFRAGSVPELFTSILRDAPVTLPDDVPERIRTVARRCLEKDPERRYRDAGEISRALEPHVSDRAHEEAGARPRRAAFLMLATAGLVIAVAGITAFGPWSLREWLPPFDPAPRFDSIAVLPLENLTGDANRQFMAVGLQDALITELAKLRGINKVIARRSLRTYNAETQTPSQIAAALDVSALVTGALFSAGDRVRVSVQIVDPSTGQDIWADQYERPDADILSLQNDIVAAIADAIGLKLSPADRRRLETVRQVDPETYGDYLRGMFHLNRSGPGDVRAGLQFLERAVERDPGNPHAYAGLALGYATIGHGPNATPDVWSRARAAAERAVTLDPMLAEAHAAVADVKLYYEHDWPGAERAFRRANELNPGLAMNHYHYAWYLALFGRWDDAIAAHRRAQELDPLTVIHTAWLAAVYGFSGRLDEAVAAARKSIEINEKAAPGWVALAFSSAGQGRFDQAMAAAERAQAINPVWRYVTGAVHAMAGRRDEALKIVAELEAATPTGNSALQLAHLHATLGNRDEAFRWLAFEPAHATLAWVRVDPGYQSLRVDPRFGALMRRLDLPDP